MTRLFLIYILAFFFPISESVLPPGYEDELYCPEHMCLKHDPLLPRGFCGPKTMLYICAPALGLTGNLTSVHPKGWGDKIDVSVKEKWMSDGWRLAKECIATTRSIFSGLFVANIREKYI